MHLTKGLYPFWDDLLTDVRFTNAVLSVNKANKEGSVFVLDRPWETAAGTYVTILKDDDIYRMYYQVWPGYPDENTGIDVCYAESCDGIHWERPNLGLNEFEGSYDNNFIIRDICDNIVRFAPVIYGPEQLAGMHGLNENIEYSCLPGCVDFYKNMILRSGR